jgi:hypothetical protein
MRGLSLVLALSNFLPSVSGQSFNNRIIDSEYRRRTSYPEVEQAYQDLQKTRARIRARERAFRPRVLIEPFQYFRQQKHRISEHSHPHKESTPNEIVDYITVN